MSEVSDYKDTFLVLNYYCIFPVTDLQDYQYFCIRAVVCLPLGVAFHV